MSPSPGPGSGRLRLSQKALEDPKPDASQHRLRRRETRYEIKEGPGLASSKEAAKRQARDPAQAFRLGSALEEPIEPTIPTPSEGHADASRLKGSRRHDALGRGADFAAGEDGLGLSLNGGQKRWAPRTGRNGSERLGDEIPKPLSRPFHPKLKHGTGPP